MGNGKNRIVVRGAENGLTGGHNRIESKIIEIIKEMEAESGVPVQITLDMEIIQQDQAKPQKGKKVFGSLYERPVDVTRVRGLDQKYLRDVELLEGHYANLRKLNDKILKLSALYGDFLYGPHKPMSKAFEIIRKMLQERFHTKHLYIADSPYLLLSIDGKPMRDIESKDTGKQLIPLHEASDALTKAGIEHLLYHMRTTADGCSGYSPSPIPIALYHAISSTRKTQLTKVADINIPLLKDIKTKELIANI